MTLTLRIDGCIFHIFSYFFTKVKIKDAKIVFFFIEITQNDVLFFQFEKQLLRSPYPLMVYSSFPPGTWC